MKALAVKRPRTLSYKAALEYALALKAAAVVLPPRHRKPGPGLEDAHYDNRAMKRARGQRGYVYGFGTMASSLKTRRPR